MVGKADNAGFGIIISVVLVAGGAGGAITIDNVLTTIGMHICKSVVRETLSNKTLFFMGCRMYSQMYGCSKTSSTSSTKKCMGCSSLFI